MSVALAAREESHAALDRRYSTADGVDPRSSTAGILARRALSGGRIIGLVATRGFHDELLAQALPSWSTSVGRRRWLPQSWHLEGSLVDCLKQSPDDPLLAIENWLAGAGGGKRYKFVGILLNTDTSRFERTVKEFITQNPGFLRDESGSEVLILHPYVGGDGSDIDEQRKLTYDYIHELNIDRLDLPIVFVFPLGGIDAERSHDDESSLAICLEQGRKGWVAKNPGADQDYDYVTYVFRCLFDAIESVPETASSPINRLREEFGTRLKKKTGHDWSRLIMKDIPELPIIKRWIMPLVALIGKLGGM